MGATNESGSSGFWLIRSRIFEGARASEIGGVDGAETCIMWGISGFVLGLGNAGRLVWRLGPVSFARLGTLLSGPIY